MDLNLLLGRFFNDEGNIELPDLLNLAVLAETVYQMSAAAGSAQRVVMRSWSYASSPEGDATETTLEQANTRIKAVAARLQQTGELGQRVAVMAGNSPEYLIGFYGAMYAGMIPVPLFDPLEPGHGDHLRAVLADCQPAAIVTNKATAGAVRQMYADRPGRERPRIIAVDALPDTTAKHFVNPIELAMKAGKPIPASMIDTPAFIQYTSGSTRTPAGVELTHRSVLTNILQTFVCADIQQPIRLVSWIPMHHDMGIILGAAALAVGAEHDFMAPRDFVQQPSRWLSLLSRRSDDEHTYSAAPNFALELTHRYAASAEGIDLSRVSGLICGSEPVTESAVESFVETFKDRGFRRSSLRPSYGLAEASLLVTTPHVGTSPVSSKSEDVPPYEGPVAKYFDRDALSEGRVVETERGEKSVTFFSNGRSLLGQYLTIVDPETRLECADGVVGEIWLRGDNMASCYVDRPEQTAETFENTLASAEQASASSDSSDDTPFTRVSGAPAERWLATGDLGVLVDGELYITGRIKDLVVIAGRNHYPQDIEHTAQQATSHIRPNAVAAFAVPGEDVERLVILAERDLTVTPEGDASAVDAIRSAVTAAHGVQPWDVRIMDPDAIRRSSSGKIARRVCQRAYLDETR